MCTQTQINADSNDQVASDALPTDTDDKQQLCLRPDIEPTLHPGLTLKLHQLLVLLN